MNLASFDARQTGEHSASGRQGEPSAGAAAERSAPAACRLVVDPAGEGAWQMAVDEVLLESAASQRQCSLRFYGWSQPTLSLGYFQSYADREAHAASRDCPVVRRATGGGAIVHDAELTYCLALAEGHPLASRAEALYRASHAAIARALASCGVAAEPTGVAAVAGEAFSREAEEPFLCFQRRGPFDLLVERVKVVGSAQRRRHGAAIQHGSVLLARSPHAPELPGIGELTGGAPTAQRLAEAMARELAAELGLAVGAGSCRGKNAMRPERWHAKSMGAPGGIAADRPIACKREGFSIPRGQGRLADAMATFGCRRGAAPVDGSQPAAVG